MRVKTNSIMINKLYMVFVNQERCKNQLL